jgi:hypothetical protein
VGTAFESGGNIKWKILDLKLNGGHRLSLSPPAGAHPFGFYILYFVCNICESRGASAMTMRQVRQTNKT